MFRVAMAFSGAVLLSWASMIGAAHAQEELCYQVGASPVWSGGAMMCRCPDGSYAGLGVPCASANQSGSTVDELIPYAPTNHPGYYGAIAYSQGSGAIGWSFDASDQDEADTTAKRGCRKHGSGCQIVVQFNSGCGALSANGNGGWGAAAGATQQEAEHNATVACGNHGNSGCQTIRWVCAATATQPQDGSYLDRMQEEIDNRGTIAPKDMPSCDWILGQARGNPVPKWMLENCR